MNYLINYDMRSDEFDRIPSRKDYLNLIKIVSFLAIMTILYNR